MLILGGTGKNFAAGMSGGIAYVLDEKHDLYLRVNKELVNIETVTEKHDINKIKTLLTKEHERQQALLLLNVFLRTSDSYTDKFKKIMPY